MSKRSERMAIVIIIFLTAFILAGSAFIIYRIRAANQKSLSSFQAVDTALADASPSPNANLDSASLDTPEPDASTSTETPEPDTTMSADEPESITGTSASLSMPTELETDSEEMSAEPENYDALVSETLEAMTLEEKIYQMIIVYPETLMEIQGFVTTAGEKTQAKLAEKPVCGLVYKAESIRSADQFQAMVNGQQAGMKIPLLTCVDEEGGKVTRIGSLRENKLEPMYTYRDEGEETAYRNAVTIAQEMHTYLLNTDFAPVADVWSNKANTVIGERAYSDDFQSCADLVSAAVEGFCSEHIICTLKHFPGHGDTAEDSHYATAYVNKSIEQLREEELLPFRAGIEAGADMVMIGHLTLPQIDEKPATFSEKIISNLLRKELAFDGVVITDALTMSGATNYTSSSGEACVLAILAGCDILLEPEDLDGAVESIEKAVDTGRLDVSRIDESITRILTMKAKHGLL